jgi:hypothetical protein
VAVLAATALLALGENAHAQVTTEPGTAVFPDPNKFARGLYTEGEAGAVILFGKAGDVVAPGFAIGARLGYDVFRWLAVQAHTLGSTHETKGDGPWAGQVIQTYQGTVEAKATLRFGQTAVFAEGGLGAARWSTNLLNTLDRSGTMPCTDMNCLATYRTGFTAGGGLGGDYHSLSRHFSVGARAGFFWLKHVQSSEDLIATAYLRYTF